jgi:hypothetical protein
MALGDFGVVVSPNTVARLLHVSDHLKSSFFELLPEGNHIIRAGGANHPSDHQRTN